MSTSTSQAQQFSALCLNYCGVVPACTVRAIVNIKWEVYGRGMVLLELLLHILLLGAFVAYALLLHRAVDALMVQRAQDPDGRASWGMSQVPAVLACLGFALLLATR
jgi:hypothetical protein